MDLKGRLLGNRYEIIEKIGSGGMATVYKAKCHVLNRYVAIKILRDEFTTDEEFIKRFEVEAQSAASITHPNIVSVYDVGVDGNLYYIVMELIKGKTLKEIITEEKGPLPWKWSVNIASQIASALETAHKNHIIHRDIKPHNIIITEDGVAKVTELQRLFQIQQLLLLEQQLDLYIIFHLNMQEVDLQMKNQIYIH